MEILNVVKAEKCKDHSIKLHIEDFDGQVDTKRYADIRGAVSWPIGSSPAYVCLVGQEYIRPKPFEKQAPIGRRVLLAEFESVDFAGDPLFAKIIDFADQFHCYEFYVDQGERFTGFHADFREYERERSSSIHLRDAYDADNFMVGMSRIKTGIDRGNLMIPADSLAYSQLQSITRPDLADNPEQRFYALNGLRHVISGFHRNPPIIRPPRDSRLWPRRPRGAMVA
ncbi:MAG: hypothetical protein H8E41_01285 [Desulfobulbaceae bacterium]|uniref:Uncharacterized protein n=1 Tax=Candidatus Desulfobia pelagia TaxID=2841692 RepID=A0A8J6TDF6_9BACT|nr:hypothetical protein [Candidatus Desulfobia pelagia]